MIRFLFETIEGEAFHKIIPDHHQQGDDRFGEPRLKPKFQQEHEEFSQAQPHDAGADEDDLRTQTLLADAFEHPHDAQEVIDDHRNREADGNAQPVQVFGENPLVQRHHDRPVDQKTDAAGHGEAEQLPQARGLKPCLDFAHTLHLFFMNACPYFIIFPPKSQKKKPTDRSAGLQNVVLSGKIHIIHAAPRRSKARSAWRVFAKHAIAFAAYCSSPLQSFAFRRDRGLYLTQFTENTYRIHRPIWPNSGRGSRGQRRQRGRLC